MSNPNYPTAELKFQLNNIQHNVMLCVYDQLGELREKIADTVKEAVFDYQTNIDSTVKAEVTRQVADAVKSSVREALWSEENRARLLHLANKQIAKIITKLEKE